MDKSMRFQIGAALLAAMALAGCMGPEGNPNGQAYATDTGGTITAAPQALGTVSYDPYGKPANFADMDISSVAIAPSPSQQMNLTIPGVPPTPMRQGQTQH